MIQLYFKTRISNRKRQIHSEIFQENYSKFKKKKQFSLNDKKNCQYLLTLKSLFTEINFLSLDLP